MKVHLLCTCRRKEFLRGMMMVFDTIRVGFPNAEIYAWWNRRNSHGCPDSFNVLRARCAELSINIKEYNVGEFAHPWWLSMLMLRETGKYAVIDTDMVFYENCEEFPFDTSVHLAGVWVPRFYDPVARAVTMPRIHTSFVLVPSGEHLINAIDTATMNDTAMTPLQLFDPFVYMHDGQRCFQDTMGGLSQVVGCGHFGVEQLKCYDHLHNGTIIDMVAERHPHGEHLRKRVMQAYANPHGIKNSWPEYDRYYAERRVN